MLDLSSRTGGNYSNSRGGGQSLEEDIPPPTNRDLKGIMFSLSSEDTVLVCVKKWFWSGKSEDLNIVTFNAGNVRYRENSGCPTTVRIWWK